MLFDLYHCEKFALESYRAVPGRDGSLRSALNQRARNLKSVAEGVRRYYHRQVLNSDCICM